MAKQNNDKDKTQDFFDYSGYLPAEVGKQESLRTIGGLTPIYVPEFAYADGNKAEQFPPVGGYLCYFEILPAVKKGKELFIPKLIRLVVTNDTKGCRGKGDAVEVVDVAKRKQILIPLTGNLMNNKELLDAVADEKRVHWAIFRVRGKVDVGQISPMWDWEVKLSDTHTIERTGEFSLPQGDSRIDRVLTEGKVPPGVAVGRAPHGSYDPQTGEVAS